MHPVAVILFCLTTIPVSSPESTFSPSLYGRLYNGTTNAYQYARGIAGSVGGFFSNIKQTASQHSEDIKDALLEGVVSATLDIACNVFIIPRDTAEYIEATFGLLIDGDQLTPEEIMTLEIRGDHKAANDFLEDLLLILYAQDDDVPRREVLSLLENAILLLLADNAIQYADLLSYFKFGSVLETIKQTASATKTVLIFIRDLQPKIIGLAQDSRQAIINLRRSLQAQAAATVKTTNELLTNSLKSTINAAVAVRAFDKQTGDILFSIFSDSGDTGTLKLDMIAKNVNNAKFMEILNRLVDLKAQGTAQFILLGGLEASILTLLADKAIVTASTLAPLLKALGLGDISVYLEPPKFALGYIQNKIPTAVNRANKVYKKVNLVIEGGHGKRPIVYKGNTAGGKGQSHNERKRKQDEEYDQKYEYGMRKDEDERNSPSKKRKAA